MHVLASSNCNAYYTVWKFPQLPPQDRKIESMNWSNDLQLQSPGDFRKYSTCDHARGVFGLITDPWSQRVGRRSGNPEPEKENPFFRSIKKCQKKGIGGNLISFGSALGTLFNFYESLILIEKWNPSKPERAPKSRRPVGASISLVKYVKDNLLE